MKSTELRIGNKLQIGRKIITVSAIDSSEIVTQKEGYISLGQYQPSGIHLTEEILVKAGFEGDINFGYGKDCVELNYITTDDYFQLEFKVSSSKRWLLINIKHVHELQNLYFYLTGTELNIEL
jgi:hypothetical protein